MPCPRGRPLEGMWELEQLPMLAWPCRADGGPW